MASTGNKFAALCAGVAKSGRGATRGKAAASTKTARSSTRGQQRDMDAALRAATAFDERTAADHALEPGTMDVVLADVLCRWHKWLAPQRGGVEHNMRADAIAEARRALTALMAAVDAHATRKQVRAMASTPLVMNMSYRYTGAPSDYTLHVRDVINALRLVQGRVLRAATPAKARSVGGRHSATQAPASETANELLSAAQAAHAVVATLSIRMRTMDLMADRFASLKARRDREALRNKQWQERQARRATQQEAAAKRAMKAKDGAEKRLAKKKAQLARQVAKYREQKREAAEAARAARAQHARNVSTKPAHPAQVFKLMQHQYRQATTAPMHVRAHGPGPSAGAGAGRGAGAGAGAA